MSHLAFSPFLRLYIGVTGAAALSLSAQTAPAPLTVSAPRVIVRGATTDMDLRWQPLAAISASSRVALSDGMSYVGVIGADGRVQRVGRNGAGPGEIQLASAIGWIGDTLWVIDGRLRRTTYFVAGAARRTIPFVGGRRGAQLLDMPVAVTPRGALLPSMEDGQASAMYRARRWSLFVASPDGAQVRDSLFDLVDPSGPLTISRGGGTMVMRQPLSYRTLVGWSGDGSWIARADRGSTSETPVGASAPRLSLRDARGRVRYDVPLPFTPRALPAPDVAQLVDSAVATLNKNPRIPPTTREDYRRALFVPARVPAVSQLLVRGDGSVLLKPWPGANGQVDYLLFDINGTVRHSIRLPQGVRMLAADSTQIIATVENSDGDVDIVAFDLLQRQR
jgi:hypothetical protein